jgi:hypothetical protein
MIIKWNVDKIKSDLQQMHVAATDPYMTGFNQWPCKQDLYRVKFYLDELLKHTSKFSGEEEWLEEQRIENERNQIWKALNDKTSNIRSRRS